MEKKISSIEIIAFHGWGFDAGFWEPIQLQLPGDLIFKAADRGYFYQPNDPLFTSEKSVYKIVFTHSFGLYWCSKELLKTCDSLVIFNGFQSFHPESKKEQKRSRLILQRMIDAFEDHPQDVLHKFYANCYFPEQRSDFELPDKVNHELLLKDLKELDHSAFDISATGISETQPVIVIDGKKDRILGEARGRSIAGNQDTEDDPLYYLIKEAGHALPATHAKDCWSFLSSMIPIFEEP